MKRSLTLILLLLASASFVSAQSSTVTIINHIPGYDINVQLLGMDNTFFSTSSGFKSNPISVAHGGTVSVSHCIIETAPGYGWGTIWPNPYGSACSGTPPNSVVWTDAQITSSFWSSCTPGPGLDLSDPTYGTMSFGATASFSGGGGFCTTANATWTRSISLTTPDSDNITIDVWP